MDGFRVFLQWLVGLTLAAALVGQIAGAAAPPAGAVIGNQASATYTDSANQQKTATSNLVETTVQQVGSYTLDQDNTKTAAVGIPVYMPHVLTNTGNGTDSFKLTLTDGGGTFASTGIAIYADTRGRGVPDNAAAPLCTGIGPGVGTCTNYLTPGIPSGNQFKFVVLMAAPGTALAGQINSVLVTAVPTTIALYTTTSITNTDKLTVTAGVSFQVTKSISRTQGPTGTTVTYKINYTNVGNAAGTLALHDVIGTGATAGFDYEEGSAAWSNGSSATTTTPLTDLYSAGVPDVTLGGVEMHYSASNSNPGASTGTLANLDPTYTGGTTTIQASITNVGPQVSGFVSFRVLVKASAIPGTSSTTNTTNYGVDDDSLPTNNVPSGVASMQSNPSAFNVLAARGVVINDTASSSSADTNGARPLPADTDTVANPDLVYIASGSPGTVITFANYVWNTGNQSDIINVSASKLASDPSVPGYGTWPANATIQLFKSDGSSPLLDSNNDGTADVGLLAVGASYKVVVKVTLPPDACSAGCPAGPFDVEVLATSVSDSTQTNKTFDRMGSFGRSPTVDLAGNPFGAYDTAVNQDAIDPVTPVPTTAKSTLPAQAAVFTLYVRNEGATQDTYDLTYSGSNAFAPATAMPAGWVVEFHRSVSAKCDAPGSLLTRIGPIPASAEWVVCALVTPPPDARAGTTKVYFHAESALGSGASDSLYDSVSVYQVNRLILSPSNTGQVAPGGTVVYSHTLSNGGNTACSAPYAFTVTDSRGAQGWSYIVYPDTNANGLVDEVALFSSPTATATSSGLPNLAPGERTQLLVKVFAPAGSATGLVDVVGVTINATCEGSLAVTSTVTDTTTVYVGQVRLVKSQVVDANCDGNYATRAASGAVAPDKFTTAPLSAKPGYCLIYQVIATNEGTTGVAGLTITDVLPSYTTTTGAKLTSGAVTIANPTCSAPTGTTGGSLTGTTFSCSGIDLAPGAAATMYLSVKINP